MSHLAKEAAQLTRIVSPLLTWYDQTARVLPWRENTDPYRVWVSEIMLQQTRVEAVKPYFERFMQALPSLSDLANAGEETLLKLWEGLGYYARVRNLQKAAKLICEQHGGNFPSRYEDMIKLPGVGAYTAGAISSISFGKPIPAVDGNVLRVVTRLTEDYRDIAAPALKEEMAETLRRIYPTDRSGAFTQSLMELGATVCLPNGSPKCDTCPLASLCLARLRGKQDNLPVKSKKAPRRKEEKTVFLLCSQGQIAVCKREQKGLLAGLWEFPNQEGLLSSKDARMWVESQGIPVSGLKKTPEKKHIFTHVEWKLRGFLVQCELPSGSYQWVNREELERSISLPTAFRQFLPFWEQPSKS